MRELGGADHHHAVLVEQALVAFHQHGEVTAVLEVEPGAAVGQHIGAAGAADVQRRAHAAAAFLVAAALLVGQASGLPEAQLGGVGAALVAARDEGGVGGRYLLQRGHDIVALGAHGVGLGAYQHEVVVHHGQALVGKTGGHKFFFGGGVVHKQHIGITPACHVDGLAGAHRDHLGVNPCGLLECRQQVAKQARLLGGRGGCHGDGLGHHRRAGGHECY